MEVIANGRVVDLGVTGDNDDYHLRDRLSLLPEGVKGDCHSGLHVLTGERQGWASNGTYVLNLRQISIVSREELAEIAKVLSLSEVNGDDLQANIVLADVPNLSNIQAGSILKFSGGAMVFITGYNEPCVGPGDRLQIRYPGFEPADFVKAAEFKRGLVGMTLTPGRILKNKKCEIIVP